MSEHVNTEATDPTPGEVGLSEAECESIRLCWGTAEALPQIERILAARNAARDAEVAEVGAYARALETIRDLSASNAQHAQAHARTTRELRAAEAREAELRATVERVRRALDDELANLADDGARLSHSVVRRIAAALTTPPTTEGGN